MTYDQTIQFLYAQLPAYHRIGKAAYKNDLNTTIALDNYFGNPHLKYRTIHVAGTNGKGSVSHMIASILQEAGYRTGLYTSPHLKDFRERIKVNGEMISENEVIAFVKEQKGIIESLKPSFFEMTIAMAFDYFAKCNVDISVIEVGLGGRLDSTNIIKPVLSVITNIGHDHMDMLGNTFGKIASEKAGIIKENVPVLISETQQATKEIFVSKAAELGSPISFADKRFSCSLEESNSLKDERRYQITDLVTNQKLEGKTVLGGDYQLRNIQAVFSVFDTLKGIFKYSEKNITDGIRNVIINTGLKGRWQILSHEPLTICDTGHNKEGLEYVLDQIQRIPKSGLHIVIGFVNDKDLKSVLPLFPTAAIYYFTKASIPRALDEEKLKSEAAKYGLNGKCYPDVKTALLTARKNASQSDMIFIGGSTFIVAEVI
ncbi:MAG: bifunctional folylpolyglutamate synthase/dihydrofolate synthase [Bacteroidia bacterium]|nr:bifunctional folylpolyglutamate synthase/dihydrofolate synthase [Bacteroidia bacterium]